MGGGDTTCESKMPRDSIGPRVMNDVQRGKAVSQLCQFNAIPSSIPRPRVAKKSSTVIKFSKYFWTFGNASVNSLVRWRIGCHCSKSALGWRLYSWSHLHLGRFSILINPIGKSSKLRITLYAVHNNSTPP